ncbi:MAG: hypothetical protein ACR2PL_10320 [Dehalococcoidia bacterium]
MENWSGKVSGGVIVLDEALGLPNDSRVLIIGMLQTHAGRDWWLPLSDAWPRETESEAWVHEREIAGTVNDGVIVPDPPLGLPDGSRVLVIGMLQTAPARDWLLTFAGIWRNDPGIDLWMDERVAERQAFDRQLA